MRFKRTKHTDPRREWIYANLPKGSEGYDFQDLDGVVSIFPHNGHQRERKRILIEHKWNVTRLTYAQQKAFQEIHNAMKRGDQTYIGFYLVTYPGKVRSVTDDEFDIDFERKPRVNGKELSWNDLKLFYLGELRIASLFA